MKDNQRPGQNQGQQQRQDQRPGQNQNPGQRQDQQRPGQGQQKHDLNKDKDRR